MAGGILFNIQYLRSLRSTPFFSVREPSVFSSRTAWLGFFQTIDKGCCSPFQGFATTPALPAPLSPFQEKRKNFFIYFYLPLAGTEPFILYRYNCAKYSFCAALLHFSRYIRSKCDKTKKILIFYAKMLFFCLHFSF